MPRPEPIAGSANIDDGDIKQHQEVPGAHDEQDGARRARVPCGTHRATQKRCRCSSHGSLVQVGTDNAALCQVLPCGAAAGCPDPYPETGGRRGGSRCSITSVSARRRDGRGHVRAVRLAPAVGRRAGVEQPQPAGAVVSHGMWLWPNTRTSGSGNRAAQRCLTPGAGPVSCTTRSARRPARRGHLGQPRPQFGTVVVAVHPDEPAARASSRSRVARPPSRRRGTRRRRAGVRRAARREAPWRAWGRWVSVVRRRHRGGYRGRCGRRGERTARCAAEKAEDLQENCSG